MHWHSWSAAPFRAAAETGRPVLLFLTAEWSRSCAEMERTTLGDARIASLVQREFVAIRVDADERPDVAERYTLDGWPSTLLLNDTGDVLHGGTFFDAPRLLDLLTRTLAVYREAARGAIARRAIVAAPTSPDAEGGETPVAEEDAAAEIAAFLLSRVDANGGFAGAPKFLHEDAILFFLKYGAAETVEAARAALDSAERALCGRHGEVYRCAAGADWSGVAPEVTPESQACGVRLFAEAEERCEAHHVDRLAAAVAFAHTTWLRPSGAGVRTDAAADLAGACLTAARVLDDVSLGRAALSLLERAALSTYRPGVGLRHSDAPDAPSLLSDHVAAIAALLDAHDATGEIPYSMLAEELAHHTLGSFKDPDGWALRDRVHDGGDVGRMAQPLHSYRLNARAARELGRLAAVSGDARFSDAAASLFGWAARRWREQGLDAAACGIAALDLID